MRRIFIPLAAGLALVAGIALETTTAGAKAPPPPPPACTTGAQIAATGDGANYNVDPYKTQVQTDPGTPPLIPPTYADHYNGGDFSFSLPLAGPSCTTATYTVEVFKLDRAGSGARPGDGVRFSAPGDGTSTNVNLTGTARRIFVNTGSDPNDDYNDNCVAAHATITVGGNVVTWSQLRTVCGPPAGRTW
ncbi:MAG: hypothetical protein QOC92_2355 [Acidimicrobiaceae bacterium]|jgi:hypothetical protein